MTTSPTLPGGELYFLLSDAARLCHQAIEHIVHEAGLRLTPAELRALAAVAKHDGSRQKALAGHIGIEPMTLSSVLDRLEAFGLITREPDPQDRRAKIVRLAPAAQGLFEALSRRAAALLDTMAAGIEPERLAGALAVLSAFRSNLSGEAEAGAAGPALRAA